MAQSARLLREKPWESMALQNPQGSRAKRSPLWWLYGQQRGMLAQPSSCWQRSNTRGLLASLCPDLLFTEAKDTMAPISTAGLPLWNSGHSKVFASTPSWRGPQASGSCTGPGPLYQGQTECPP